MSPKACYYLLVRTSYIHQLFQKSSFYDFFLANIVQIYIHELTVIVHLRHSRYCGKGFQQCHIVEPSARILEAAPEYIGDPDASKCKYICSTLQDFNPRANTYNLVL